MSSSSADTLDLNQFGDSNRHFFDDTIDRYARHRLTARTLLLEMQSQAQQGIPVEDVLRGQLDSMRSCANLLYVDAQDLNTLLKWHREGRRMPRHFSHFVTLSALLDLTFLVASLQLALADGLTEVGDHRKAARAGANAEAVVLGGFKTLQRAYSTKSWVRAVKLGFFRLVRRDYVSYDEVRHAFSEALRAARYVMAENSLAAIGGTMGRPTELFTKITRIINTARGRVVADTPNDTVADVEWCIKALYYLRMRLVLFGSSITTRSADAYIQLLQCWLYARLLLLIRPSDFRYQGVFSEFAQLVQNHYQTEASVRRMGTWWMRWSRGLAGTSSKAALPREFGKIPPAEERAELFNELEEWMEQVLKHDEVAEIRNLMHKKVQF